ncbi:MAG: hypothetical protein M3O64_04930 [Chloroflexota bacterium]|nr:hypothetical protein [Chloroflexota bacterium]
MRWSHPYQTHNPYFCSDKGPLLAEGGSLRDQFTISSSVIEAVIVSRRDWLLGEAAGPSCGLPIGKPDLDEEIREPGSAQPVGVILTHRRCAARFRLRFRG